jgi:hypothetical protein
MDTLAVDVGKLIKEIVNKSRKHSLDRRAIEEMVEHEAQQMCDAWDVCCGHDLSAILAFGLRKVLGSCNPQYVNAYSVERGLRLAYEESYFRLTQLFRSMQEWQARNAPYIILK